MVYRKQSHHPNSVNWEAEEAQTKKKGAKTAQGFSDKHIYFLHLGGWCLSSGPDMAVIADPAHGISSFYLRSMLKIQGIEKYHS